MLNIWHEKPKMFCLVALLSGKQSRHHITHVSKTKLFLDQSAVISSQRKNIGDRAQGKNCRVTEEGIVLLPGTFLAAINDLT